MRKKATLRDVAQIAGVSTATVARVLHNNGYVANETRIAVERAVEQTGYRLNLLARNLRQQRTNVIGHILYAIAPNPFYAQVALGVEQEAFSHGYSVLAFNVQGHPERERIGVETLIARQVDAILFTTPAAASNVQLALDSGRPVVQVERPTGVRTSCVLVDNYAGSVMAVEHLIELGHNAIAFIGASYRHDLSKASQLVDERRHIGYLDTMHKHGIPVQDRWVRLGRHYSIEGRGSPGDGYRFTGEFLDAPVRPTAIFGSSDFLAAGAYQAIYERGLRIPQDISVVGYDDTLGEYLAPPLTTVAQPMSEIGAVACRLAIMELANGSTGTHEVHVRSLSVQWVGRASTGPAPTPVES